jgi:DNA-binding GntR family transcriptional regulator
MNHNRMASISLSPSDLITEQLRCEILSGSLEDHSRLREVELAKRFDISRGPIRDALLSLSKEGALEVKRNAGVRIAPAWPEEVRKILTHQRLEIEMLCMQDLLHLQEVNWSLFDDNLDLLELACRREDMTRIVIADMQFHRLILTQSGNPQLETVWLALMSRMRLPYSRHNALQEVAGEHRSIYEHLRKGNEKTCIRLLKKNVEPQI